MIDPKATVESATDEIWFGIHESGWCHDDVEKRIAAVRAAHERIGFKRAIELILRNEPVSAPYKSDATPTSDAQLLRNLLDHAQLPDRRAVMAAVERLERAASSKL